MRVEAMLLIADDFWDAHRAALDGKSSVTGAVLPEALDGAPVAARAAHHAMACLVARVLGYPLPPPPAGVSVEEAELVNRRIDASVDRVRARLGLA